jgi:hypothetical protein
MEPWTARTYIRASFASIIAALVAAGTAVVGDDAISTGEWIAVAVAFFTTFGTWLGVGALPGTKIEPFYGVGAKNVEVPVPPADPEPAKP